MPCPRETSLPGQILRRREVTSTYRPHCLAQTRRSASCNCPSGCVVAGRESRRLTTPRQSATSTRSCAGGSRITVLGTSRPYNRFRVAVRVNPLFQQLLRHFTRFPINLHNVDEGRTAINAAPPIRLAVPAETR